MKKFLLFIFVLFFSCFNIINTFAVNDCKSEENNLIKYKNEYLKLKTLYDAIEDEVEEELKWTRATTTRKAQIIANRQKDLLLPLNLAINNYNTYSNSYNTCVTIKNYDLSIIWDKWIKSFNNQNYDDVIKYFLEYYNNIDISNPNYEWARNNLSAWYANKWNTYFNKWDYDNALYYYNLAIKYWRDTFWLLANVGQSYYNKWDYNNAKIFFNKAYNKAVNVEDINFIKLILDDIKEREKNAELLKNAPTNDIYSWYQYYLKQLNIPNAWKKVTNKNQVIVAVIDDWISINHPDLVNSIWIDSKAKYGSSKIIDFVWDWMPANLPVWEHWTIVAWIIWATKNNSEWIAWIANNVKLMPLRVFDTNWWAKEENIIKAMNYAIDNWANIINLSLWLNQFSYSTKFDSVIKRAFDKGIIVVIAAWNWDLLTGQQTWVNLTNNPISPVCNNEWKFKYSIWVFATDENWYRTNWTNYWNCANFWAPWEWIISTSISVFNSNYWTNYNSLNWTSFSAPIISWIIALWYNQLWFINPITIYDTLEESKVAFKLPDWQTWYKIDAAKYIDILQNKIWKIKQTEQENKIKAQANKLFNSIKVKINRYSKVKRESAYKTLLSQLENTKAKAKWDKLIITNILIEWIKKELWINDKDIWLWDLLNK